MNADQLIEAEAEWLFSLMVDPDYSADRWHKLWIEESDKEWWRDRALAHFKALNGWGVRLLDPNQKGLVMKGTWANCFRVMPLPEAKE